MISDYVVLDLEMTGLSAKTDQIIEIGAVKIREHKITETMECFVNPKCPIPTRITELTGITDEMVLQGEERDAAVGNLLRFIDGNIIVGHNINFDYSFLKQWAVNNKRTLTLQGCDTLKLARALLPAEQSKTLESLCVYFGIERKRAHRALDDALETWEIYERLVELALEKGDYEDYLKPRELVYHAKKQSPATQRQVERLREYRFSHGICDEINWENLTKSEASRMMDRYILEYGR